MDCVLCGGKIEKNNGVIILKSKMFGIISVPGINYELCLSCGDITLSCFEAEKAHQFLCEKENKVLQNLPIQDFIPATEASKLLGFTLQEFNKNSRIQRGFIYSITTKGQKYYYKRSVLVFKTSGNDGRVKIQV
jgi:hypothetical protein